MSDISTIEPDNLPAISKPAKQPNIQPDKLLDEIVLQISRGNNISQAARAIGISRLTVYNHLKAAGLTKDDIEQVAGYRNGKRVRLDVIANKLSQCPSDDEIKELTLDKRIKTLKEIETIQGNIQGSSEQARPQIVFNIAELAINQSERVKELTVDNGDNEQVVDI
jgi:hypothetical protein